MIMETGSCAGAGAPESRSDCEMIRANMIYFIFHYNLEIDWNVKNVYL